MNISDVRIRAHEPSETSQRLASVQVTLGNSLVLYGIGLMRTKETDDQAAARYWLSMPARKIAEDGEEPRFIDYAHPINQETRNALTEAIIGHYEKVTQDAEAAFAPVGADEPLEIESVTLTYPKNDSNLLAFASVVLNCGIRLTQIRLIKRKDSGKMLLLMPTRTRGERNLEVFHPISQEFRNKLTDAVVAKYMEEQPAQPAAEAEAQPEA